MSKFSKLANYSQAYEKACDVFIVKIAMIRKLPNGKYRVLSQKGKNLGTYNTREEAKKRLKQVEYFKHVKASKENNTDNYSSIMRNLNKHYDKETISEFQAVFKKNFDAAMLKNEENPEEIALQKSVKSINLANNQYAIIKAANAVQLGDPHKSGQYLANLIRFLMTRIKFENRAKALANLKRKIYYLNEYEMASKKIPASAAIGQSLLFLKHIFVGQNPGMIRDVLNSIVSNL